MRIPAFVRSILSTLHRAGHRAYIVGGALRDALLDLQAADWDVATSASPDRVTALFSHRRCLTLKHGTVAVVHDGRTYEITSFRDHRCTIRGDLSLRDFTVNAMAYDVREHRLLDPFEGRRDLAGKLVRAVGEPEARFREDPVRMLRAARFAADLGFRIDAATLYAMPSVAHRLDSVSPERLRDELIKIVACPDPARALEIMVRSGSLGHLLPELLEGYGKHQNLYHAHTILTHAVRAVDLAGPDPVVRLAALLHDVAKPRVRERHKGGWRFRGHAELGARMARRMLERLRFGTGTVSAVTRLVEAHMVLYEPAWSDAAVRRLIGRVGPDLVGDLLSLRLADLLAHGPDDRGSRRFQELIERGERAARLLSLLHRPGARRERKRRDEDPRDASRPGSGKDPARPARPGHGPARAEHPRRTSSATENDAATMTVPSPPRSAYMHLTGGSSFSILLSRSARLRNVRIPLNPSH